MTDVPLERDVEDGGVIIQIWLEENDPPRGKVATGLSDPLPFIGWLGLLRVLSELLAPPERD